jgi:uncharacterized protein (DUF983 family)
MRKGMTKICPNCQSENKDTSDFCQKCDNDLNEFPTKYGNVSLLGLAGLIFFIPFVLLCIVLVLAKVTAMELFIKLLIIFFTIPFICGSYLLTRPERFAKKRGKFIIRISLGVLIFYLIVVMYLHI